MLRQQSPALHVRPVSEYPTRMTSKQGACNFSTKMGNEPNNSYSFLPLNFISCPDLLNCAQPHYINGWAWCWEMGWLHRSFQPGTWEAGYNLPSSSPSKSKAVRGGWSSARFVDTLTMIAFLTAPTSGAYEIHHFRGVICASSHRPWCAHRSSTWRFLFLFLRFSLFCAVSSVIRHIVLQRSVYKLYVTTSTCYLFGFPFGRRNQ